MGAGSSTPATNKAVMPNLSGLGGNVILSTNAKRNAEYNALNANQKKLVNNVRSSYGRPNMPVKEALNLGAVPTIAAPSSNIPAGMSNEEAGIPKPVGGGRRKTARKGKKASRKAKKSKKGGRK